MGAGPFCTKPGLMFIPAGTGFAAELAEASKDKPTAAMLTGRIAGAYPDGLRGVASVPAVDVVTFVGVPLLVVVAAVLGAGTPAGTGGSGGRASAE